MKIVVLVVVVVVDLVLSVEKEVVRAHAVARERLYRCHQRYYLWIRRTHRLG